MRGEELSYPGNSTRHPKPVPRRFADLQTIIAAGLVLFFAVSLVMAVQSTDQFFDSSEIERMGIDPNTLSQQQIRDILSAQSQQAYLSSEIEEVNDENEPNRLALMATKPSAIEKLLSAELTGMVFVLVHEIWLANLTKRCLIKLMQRSLADEGRRTIISGK